MVIKNDNDIFVSFIANKMRTIKNVDSVTVFAMEFGSFISNYCIEYEIKELDEIMHVAYDILYGDMDTNSIKIL